MDEPQVLLILVGLPGSGKTTFAEALVARSWQQETASGHEAESSQSGKEPRLGRRRWVRASQDDAPSRRRQECEAAVKRGLAEGHNVLVDRVGFDKIQRSHFIHIARQHQPPPQIWCLVLSVSPSTLETRLLARPDHPTIKDPETAMRVLREMTRLMEPPRPGGGEGFDRIYTLSEDRQSPSGQWTEAEVAAVLHTIGAEGKGDEGLYVPVEQRPAASGSMAGRGGYQGRGRGRGGPWRGGPPGPYQPRPRQDQPWSSRDAHAPYPPYPPYGQPPSSYAGYRSGERSQPGEGSFGFRQPGGGRATYPPAVAKAQNEHRAAMKPSGQVGVPTWAGAVPSQYSVRPSAQAPPPS